MTEDNQRREEHLHIHDDPALDPHHQHVHGHLHHAASAHKSVEIHADTHIGGRVDTPPLPPIEETKYILGDKDASQQSVDLGTSAEILIEKRYSATLMYRKYKWIWHIFIGLFFTAWWISILAQDKHRHMWLIPTLLWMAIIARLITFYVPTRPILTVADWIWQRTVVRIVSFVPEKLQLWAGGLGTIAVILIGTFCSPVFPGSALADRAISFFGCCVAIFGLWATSKHRSRIQWRTVITGMLFQYIIALFVLRTKAGYDIFNFISFLARELLGFATDGLIFITSKGTADLGFWCFSVLPAIIFFIAFVHILFYWGVIQWFVVKFATFFFWSMKVSGAEAVVAAASPFIGQGESAILIKPFIVHLTDAEIHQIMASGFATIAGSVLVAYIGMGLNAQALVSSCVMSIPASLATSKLRHPETEETLTSGRVVIPDDDISESENVLDAFAKGAWLGLTVALTITANILVIIALVSLIDALLTWFGGFWNIKNLTLEMILGYIFYPVAFLLGAPRNELYPIAKLIGIKIIQNEFVAYAALTGPEYANLSTRGRMLATYALCGFANLGSVGINVGVLGKLAPSRSGAISRQAISALITGAISTLLSAAVAGMVLADLTPFESQNASTNN